MIQSRSHLGDWSYKIPTAVKFPSIIHSRSWQQDSKYRVPGPDLIHGTNRGNSPVLIDKTWSRRALSYIPLDKRWRSQLIFTTTETCNSVQTLHDLDIRTIFFTKFRNLGVLYYAIMCDTGVGKFRYATSLLNELDPKVKDFQFISYTHKWLVFKIIWIVSCRQNDRT